MESRRLSRAAIDDDLRAAVVEFLRDWLPAAAIAEYRRMMLADPERWSEDPHFSDGFIPNHVLRGNGITEAVLGVADLDTVWPDLLKLAVLGSACDEHLRGTRGVEQE